MSSQEMSGRLEAQVCQLEQRHGGDSSSECLNAREMMHSELTILRALGNVCTEHQVFLDSEREVKGKEQERIEELLYTFY